MTSSTKRIHIGDSTVLELLLGPQDEWLGIGAITVQGVTLRIGDYPMVIRLDTPDGYLYTQYFLDNVTTGDDGAVAVRFRAIGIPWRRQEYQDEYEQPLYNLRVGVEPVEDSVTLLLAPAARRLGDRDWTGFSYRFAYASEQRQIHRLLVHASWELGGAFVGNTVLQQGQCNMPVYRGAAETLFTTTCLKTLQQYGSPQGVSFQLAPRAGLLQGFDFQYGDAGALFQCWPDCAGISSVLESSPGCDRLQVVDEYHFTLASQAETTPQDVLFTPGPLAEYEARDLWWEALQAVYGGLRKKYGVVESVVRPELPKSYHFRVDGERQLMTIGGVEVETTEVPYAIAEHVLPKLAKIGIRRFWPEVMLQSDVTELGMKRKWDTGIHGDLHCGSVCTTHRVFPADFWGGIAGWKYMADRAHALGMQIGSWFPAHFSPWAAIFREHPEWRITGPNSTTFGGGYGFNTLVSVDWNTPFLDWVVDDVRRWKAEAGLDFLWVDSYSNLGLLMTNYAEGMRTNFAAFGRLFGELSKLGLQSISFESVSAFGLLACGFTDLRGDHFEQDHSVAGQNDFGWWVGHEDMTFNTCMYNVHTRKRSEDELHTIQFRMMANRGFAMLQSLVTGIYQIPDWWVTLNHTYEQALPHMKTRRLLPDGAGVRWLDGDTQLIWAFRDLEIPISRDARVEELLGQDARIIAHGDTLAVNSGHVYRLR